VDNIGVHRLLRAQGLPDSSEERRMNGIPKATIRKHEHHYRVYIGDVHVGLDDEAGCKDLADELNEDESKREFLLELFKDYDEN